MRGERFGRLLHRGALGLRWLGKHELGLLLVVVVLAFGTWGTVALAIEVFDGSTHDVERSILLALREPTDLSDPIGPRWFEGLVRDVTALGGTGILVLLSLMVAGYLLLRRSYRTVLFLVVAIGGGNALTYGLKFMFERPRPDVVTHGAMTHTASFPSGHAMLSAVTYLTLGVLLAQTESRYRAKAYILCVALLLMVMVGLSRIYMGVHWPTDVLAGWSMGTSWALLCWVVARGLQLRGALEPPTDGEFVQRSQADSLADERVPASPQELTPWRSTSGGASDGPHGGSTMAR